MSLRDLKHEVLKPAYVMCNECKFLNKKVICEVYKRKPPKEVIIGNPFKEKENKNICKYFEKK